MGKAEEDLRAALDSLGRTVEENEARASAGLPVGPAARRAGIVVGGGGQMDLWGGGKDRKDGKDGKDGKE